MKKVTLLILLIGFVVLGAVGMRWFGAGRGSSVRTLRVMTYSSFVSVLGPGPQIKKKFEQVCQCRIKWLKVPDSTLFTQRLSLKKDGFKTDAVVGLDQLSLKSALSLPWKEISAPAPALASPARLFLSKNFVPYDWSPMSFISRKNRPVLSLQDLLKPEFKNRISLPAPRNSTAGLQFYYWLWWALRDTTEDFLKKFKDRLYGLPPSWSTSYALFQRGHVDLSFSYLGSLLYHQEQNQKDFYFVQFKEGHPFQVELAGVSGFCSECNLARQFILFLLQPEVQILLTKKNYMFPVVREVLSSFTKAKAGPPRLLREVKLIPYNEWDLFLDQKENRLKIWDKRIK